ncbi:uncharacterized protein EV420DRAFT_295479 [Desarmillaria tabescens]|uniref:Integrase core domain-containing protein n=1 Tax=Armillaria tabescens TaxID=1929756 RepID=A0AA39J6P4_ARMTA|nr:uncharacterized protein EV420DRAFT_295479 [Desarmillaria tabescens]KAK0435804.1 hypothetical protein EV420DRAFT_295479 [Desarmillaria tabescens]
MGKHVSVVNIRASNSNRPYVVLMVFIDATLVWGVPIRLRGDHGVENLYAAQWMENYQGVLSNCIHLGPVSGFSSSRLSCIDNEYHSSVHNTRGERMWVETSRSWADRWHEFFTELEASYRSGPQKFGTYLVGPSPVSCRYR